MDIDARELPIGFLLNTLGRRVLEETEAAVAQLDISVIELDILWLVDLAPDRPQIDYARFQKRDVTTFGRYVDRLEGKGMIVRTPGPSDRRVKTLSVTDAGRQVMHSGREKALEVEQRLFAGRADGIDPAKSLLVDLLESLD